MARRPPAKRKATSPEATKTVVEAGPVAVKVEAGEVAVVVAPPARGGIGRRPFTFNNALPHSATTDRCVSVLSHLREGLGWGAGGGALAMVSGSHGRRAQLA